jgi:hypothetical protein
MRIHDRANSYESLSEADSNKSDKTSNRRNLNGDKPKDTKLPIKIKNYTGQDPSFNLEDFTRHLEQYERYYKWTNSNFVEHALVCLSGAALSCMKDHEEEITNWPQLKDLLQKNMEPEGYEIRYLGQLNNITLRKGENLSDYADRVKRLGKLAYPDIRPRPREKMLVKIFAAGIKNDDIRKAIAFQQIRTINDALRIAASDPDPEQDEGEGAAGNATPASRTALKKTTVHMAITPPPDPLAAITDGMSRILQAVSQPKEPETRQSRYRRDQTPPAPRYYDSREGRESTPPPYRHGYEKREAGFSRPQIRERYGNSRSPSHPYQRNREQSRSPAPYYRRAGDNQPRQSYHDRPRSRSADRTQTCFKCQGGGHMIKDCISEDWYEIDKQGVLAIKPRRDNNNYPNERGAPPRSGAAPYQ